MDYTGMNEVIAQYVEKQGPRRSSAAMKRPRPSTEDSAPLREALKVFGQRATALDAELSTLDKPPVAFQGKLWTLVLELRPYFLVALSSNELQIPEEMKKLCQAEDPHRLLRYVWLALRIYISVARIAAVVPGVLLHSILTLFSLLPVFGAPSLLAATDEKMLFKGINQALIVLSHRYPSVFQQLLHTLLREDTMGAFIFSPTPGRRRSYGRCLIELCDPPVVHGVPLGAGSLFALSIVSSSVYESVCVARGLCEIMTDLFKSNVPFQPTLGERGVLFRLACSLLTVDFHEGPMPRLVSGFIEPLEGVSGAYPSDEKEPSLLNLFQTSAGATLCVMMSHGFFIKSIHGPMLFYTLTQHLCVMSFAKEMMDLNVTWELELLRWLTETSVTSGDASTSPVIGETRETDISDGVEGISLPHKWLENLFLKPRVLNDVIRALIGCVHRQTSSESIEAGTILLKLLREMIPQHSCMPRLIEEAFYGMAADMINALLDARILQPMLWLADASPRLGVLHQLIELFPLDTVRPFIQRHLTLRYGKEPADSHLLATANASVVLRDEKSIQSTFSEAWKRLANGESVIAAEAVVILLRSAEEIDMESMARGLLEAMAGGTVTLRHLDSPPHVALLYSALLERLPISSGGGCEALCFMKKVMRSREENSDLALWRTIGVLRGFRKRIAQQCRSRILVSASPCWAEVEAISDAAAIMLTTLREISEVLEMIALSISDLSFEESASDEAPMLFWQQMVALVTDTVSITEWLRSHLSACGNGEAATASEVIVLDDEEEEETAKMPETLNLEDGVFIVASSKRCREQPHRQHSSKAEKEEGEEGEEKMNSDSTTKSNRGGGVEAVLRGISAPLEAIGWAGRQFLIARSSLGSDELNDTLLSFVCLCVALSPVRWDAMEEIILSRGLNHSNCIIRRGYAALALRIFFTRWDNESITHMFSDNLLRFEENEAAKQHFFLETLQAAFTGEFQTVLVRQGIYRDVSSFAIASLPLVIAPTRHKERSRKACSSVLEVCIKIWEQNDFTLSTKSAALTAAHAIMLQLSWSVADLCWRDAEMIYTSFFKAMCDLEESDVREVVLASLEDLLPHCVLSDGGEEKLQRIAALLWETPSPGGIFSRVMAHILLEYARESVSVKLEKVQKLLGFLSRPLEELPEMVAHSRESLIVSLIYLEAGRRLREAGSRRETMDTGLKKDKRENVGDGVLSNFNLAVEMALAIVECGPLTEMILQALVTPVTITTEGRALTKDVFYVLDAMAELVGLSNGPLKKSHHVPICIVRRCLCSLSLLIRFLGSHATSIAPKLPAILEHCSVRSQLVRPVCAVWRDLIANCKKEYLKEHSPAIVVDILSMGQLAEGHGGSRGYDDCDDEGDPLPLLEEAMRIVYESSSQEAFWESYFKVMGKTNVLIHRLGVNGGNKVSAAESLNVENTPIVSERNATVVVAGFLSVMHSSSTKCKEVFVRALYQYLSKTDSAGRMEMTRAAGASPQLIPTLLNCACELRDDHIEYILACVGMIGAAAHSHAPLLATGRELTPREGTISFSLKSGRSADLRGMQFLPEDVLDWRTLAHKLLSVYCPRALANTADPTMHDRAAYAVQQLLRVCTDAERQPLDRLPLQTQEVLHVDELNQYTWWSHLEPTCRQMLAGYTTTRYDKRVITKTERRSPVYFSKMSFSEWMDSWFCDLVERCEGVFGRMMGSLRNMAKGDHALITFLLPLIIVHLLRAGNVDHCNAVLLEVMNLLHAASPDASHGKEQSGSIYSQSIMREVVTPGARATGVEEHVQEVFHILEDIEHLRLNLIRAIHQLNVQRGGNVDQSEMMRVDDVCKQFLLQVDWTTRAKAAVAIGSNVRALRCIESQRYLPSIQDVMQKNISLQRIFATLGDRDSSRSLHRTQEHQLEDAAFSYENNGEWSLALQASELVLQQRPNSINHQFTALRCMQQLGQLHLMSRYSQALLLQSSRVSAEHRKQDKLFLEARMAALQNYANEAAWRLGEWKNIQTRQDLPVSLAPPIVAFNNLLCKRGTLKEVFSACKMQRRKIAPVIRAAFRESYAQVYQHVVVLHALTDIETAAETVTSLRAPPAGSDGKMISVHDDVLKNAACFREFGSLLQQRARLTESTPETQELLMSLHRSIFRAFDMKEEVTNTWMQHAKMLRDEGFLEAALSAAKQASFSDGFLDPSHCTTVAKLLYEMNMSNQAIEFAEDAVNNKLVPLVIRANLRVLVTRWRQETGYQTSREVIAGYESALKMSDSEKAHHHLALFYDTLYRSIQSPVQESGMVLSASSDDMEDKKMVRNVESYVLQAIHHFGLALRRGSKTMIVSLPRMLTLWLNCSAILATLTSKSGSISALADSVLKKMNEMMELYLLQKDTKLPATQLIMALPQLLSRIGHENTRVVEIITGTVVNLMMEFPQQCLWQVLPIVFSKQHHRRETVHNAIVLEFVKRIPSEKKLVENMLSFFKSFIELCNCPATSLAGGRSSSEVSIAGQSFMQRIQRILPSTRIILPTMANLSPNVMHGAENSSVFAGSAAFKSLEDRVTIMSSLQKPKRITVVSDEGERVLFLCKARDEPRKDMRMMEIASLMNTFFLTDPEPRRKRFALRRYAVSALSDDCAIIEWVNNLSPFRRVVEDCYAMDGTGVRVSQVKVWKSMVDSGSLSKLDMLQKHIFPKTRPVLHGWFHRHFHSHQEWFNARNSYTQATALWSIAGHIVGLGDRHGENLMLDLRCGELMHVDFACLFDKGESLEVPERVRFRLTQNVVDGMGILGVDGPFRASCQVALRCQMKNKTAVMSVVETLLYEPLVEWTRHSSLRQRNFDPKQLIGRVSRRLDGFLDLYSSTREKDTFALSCEGQVSRLISHSSAVENLAEMYVWWMPWL
ncbi:putative phosphatidylinositol 3-related kinase [Trypanosoma cruzi]|uniref:non-specific serine/threonine protein kinase n=2 Tax=Trypanosoma cruzi TaxID=5693 RepID=A0A2V2XFD5_TRYCR|nr:putative phosphatidylinositol 3-related kinase [Trypanosoma cruzi]